MIRPKEGRAFDYPQLCRFNVSLCSRKLVLFGSLILPTPRLPRPANLFEGVGDVEPGFSVYLESLKDRGLRCGNGTAFVLSDDSVRRLSNEGCPCLLC